MVIAIFLASADLSTTGVLLVVGGALALGGLVAAGALLYRYSTRVVIGRDGLQGANQHKALLPWDQVWGFWWEVVSSGATTGDLDPRPWVRLAVSRRDGEAYAVSRWVRKGGPFGDATRVGRELRAAAHDGIVPEHVALPSDQLPPPARTIGFSGGILPNSQRPQPPSG